MNYKGKNILGVLFAAILAFLLIAACSNILDYSGHIPQEGMGTVQILFSSNTARTILPSKLDDAESFYYILVFTPAAGTKITRELEPDSPGLSIDLVLGDWNLEVWGFPYDPGNDPDTDDALVHAKQDIKVVPGINPPVKVELEINSDNLSQEDKGYLQYILTLPTNSSGRLNVYDMNNNLVDTTYFPRTLNAGSNTGERILDSDFYYIQVSIERGSGETMEGTSWIELVHIYDGTISIAEKSFLDAVWYPVTGRITSFGFNESYYEDSVVIDNDKNEINIIVRPTTNPASLTPTLEFVGMHISPHPGQTMDFSNPRQFTVYADGGIGQAYFERTYTINVEVGTYIIALDNNSNNFGSIGYGYDQRTPATVTVTNEGNRPTGPLNVRLEGTDANSFTLSATSLDSIAVGGDDSFTVRPNNGLGANNNSARTYNATIIVERQGYNISESYDVSFTVNPALISEASVEVTAPVKGGTPATTATVPDGANYTVSQVSWIPVNNPFGSGIVYTVTVTLQANSNYAFNDSTTAKVNGQNASIFSSSSSTLTLTYTYPATISHAELKISMDDFEMEDQDVFAADYEITLQSTDDPFTVTLPDGIDTALWTNFNLTLGEGNSIELDPSQFGINIPHIITVSFVYDNATWLVNITLIVE